MSLRLRLFLQALAAILLSLLVLALLLGSSWWRSERSQLDARLCMEARRLVSPKREDRADTLTERHREELLRRLRLDSEEQLQMERHFGREYEPGRLANQALDWQAARGEGLGRCELAEFDDAQGHWRVVRNRTQAGSAWLAASLAPLRDEGRSLVLGSLGLALPIALGLALISAWLLALTMMGPLNRLREAMRQQRPERLEQRLPVGNAPRELRELTEAYNTMLARLEASFHQASRFSADAAHELRTPLTILQGRLERAIAASEGRALQAELGAMLDSTQRLAAIVRQLLLLSRADAGRLDLQREPVNLSALLQELVQDIELLAEGRRLSLAIEPDLSLMGDALLLRQLFNNLLSNALTHGRPQGELALEAQRVAQGLRVRLRNDCEPLPPEARARLFDRFYRAAPERRREGSGLGLSLAREIARAHGGTLHLLEGPADQVTLEVLLPPG